ARFGEVALWTAFGADREHVSDGVVAEEDLLAGRTDGEGDVGAVRHAVRAVVFVPALVDGDLRLVVAGGKSRGEGVDPVAVRILEPRAETARIPVARASQLALKAPGRDGNGLAVIVGDPVGLVGVIELHRGG